MLIGMLVSRTPYGQWPLAALALFGLLAGCGRTAKELPVRYRVRGTVTYNGQPVAGATLTFWPLPLQVNDWRAVRPIAIVADDGTFEPNSYGDRDGAVPGQYAVTLIRRAARTSPDSFGGRYGDPAHPIATVTIEEGDNVLPPIALVGPVLPRLERESSPGQ